MVTFTITYQGDLRCQSIHDPSCTVLLTDAPVDNQGRGESFSPTDLICTGLAACVLTTMGIVARREGIHFEGAKARAEKHMTAMPPRKIARLVVAVIMPAGLSADARSILERAGHSCPVKLSLHPDIVIELSFAYPN